MWFNFFIARLKWVVYSLSFLFHKGLYILQKQPTRPIQVLLAFKWVLENSFLVKLEAGGAWIFAGNDLLQKFFQTFSVNFNPNKDGLFEGSFCWGTRALSTISSRQKFSKLNSEKIARSYLLKPRKDWNCKVFLCLKLTTRTQLNFLFVLYFWSSYFRCLKKLLMK